MTKRISQANTVVVPATVKAAEGQGVAAKAVIVPGEVEAGAAKADVAEKDAPTTAVVEPVAALVAPAPLAMVAAQDTTTTTTADTSATTTAQSDTSGDGTDYTPYIVGGVLLAGGILAVALSSDDNNSSTPTPSTPTPTPTNAVTFSSATTASIAENTPGGASGNVVIDVNAAAAATGGAIVYTLGGTDAAAFNINASTGEVRFNASPNFEAKSSYSITVTGTSAANGTTPSATATQTITVSVTNVNEAPTFASATVTATPINENSAITTPVFTAAATDPDGTAAPNTLTYSLGTTGDSALFSINATTGAVSLRAPADFETKSSYTFAVVATDQGGLSATQTVTLNINNVNEAPTFGTATTRAVSYAENGTAALFATGGASDPDGTAAPNTLTYSLTGADAALFSVNAQTGSVSFRASPDFETPRSAANSNVYSFNLVATDQGGLSATQANTITVTDVAEGPPSVTVSLDAAGPFSGLGTGGAAQSTIFTDNGTVASNSVINNFGRDDIVRFLNTGTNTVSFSSNNDDLLIEFTVNGVVNNITINDIVSPNAIITSEASAEAAVNAFFGTTGVDYFRFG